MLLLNPFGNAPDACVVKDGDCEVYNRLIPVSMPVWISASQDSRFANFPLGAGPFSGGLE